MRNVHTRITKTAPATLMIIAPRHVHDGDALEQMAMERFDHVARRSKNDAITAETQIYIADTIGDMGLWYRLAPVSFVGHSIDAKNAGLEGKNPFEAAALGSAILHGPAVSYFAESYQALSDAGGAVMVHDATSLSDAVLKLQSQEARADMVVGARRVIDAQSAV